jgi:hypothetical protein
MTESAKRAARVCASRAKILEADSRLAFSNIGDVQTIEDGKLVVKDHAALTLLARIYGMLINRQEISRRGGGPIEVDHMVDQSARIRSRLDEIARRPRPPYEQPILVDVTPARQASPGALSAARIQGKRDE